MPRKPSKKQQAIGKLVSLLANRALVARYDSLRPDILKRPPEIRTDLSETEQVFYASNRIKAYMLADDLYDNTSVASTIDTAIRITIGKRGGTPLFTGADKEFAQRWYTDWKRHCGYAEGENLQEILALVLRLVKLHGDCIVWCDPVLTDGKIRIFDADQICNVNCNWDVWVHEHGLPESTRQVEGCVVDGTGKCYGYFVTQLRNRYGVDISDAMFLPINTCRRVAYHRKHTQYRGESSIIRNQILTDDTKELLKSEIGAAKLASELALIVKQPEGLGTEISKYLEGFSDTKTLTDGTGINPDDLQKLGEVARDSKTFEAYAGKSAIASVPHGTEVENLNNAVRPSQPIQSWINLLDDTNGKALGVMSLFSRGRADNSYSSGMIEIEVSWKQFEEDQKLLERNVIDYCLGVLLPNTQYEVYWDKAIQIDQEKYEKTCDMALRGGRTTYRELLGSDWKDILTELAEEKKFIKSIGLDNLSIFQTSSGQELTETEQAHMEDDKPSDDEPPKGDNDNGQH